jgi:hypothetical protein
LWWQILGTWRVLCERLQSQHPIYLRAHLKVMMSCRSTFVMSTTPSPLGRVQGGRTALQGLEAKFLDDESRDEQLIRIRRKGKMDTDTDNADMQHLRLLFNN